MTKKPENEEELADLEGTIETFWATELKEIKDESSLASEWHMLLLNLEHIVSLDDYRPLLSNAKWMHSVVPYINARERELKVRPDVEPAE